MRHSFFKHWILAAAVLLAPAIADAAGLGRLTVLSALGQPFSAEIELSADRSELPSLAARIAPREAYQRANLQMSGALAGARVSVERRAGGQNFVRIVTNQPVNEPFVDLLIELTWENGKIVREYTALLDPPGYAQQPAAAAAAPVAAPESRPAAGAAAPAATPAASPAAAPAAVGSGKDYGPVKRGDTLAKIAGSLKPEGVTLEQMLVGLYRSNPDAFIMKNMNLMKTGKILRVPEKDELVALAQKDAAKEVRVQAADWKSYIAKVADSAAAAPEGRTTASGKITARVDEKGSGEAKDVVKLSKGEPPGASGKDKPRSAAEKVRALEEEAVAREKSLKEANERVAQLEKTIQDMKKLAELKSPGMAAAQQAATKPPAGKPEAAKPEPAKADASKPEPAKPAATKPEAAPPAKPEAAPAAKPDAAAPAPAADAKKDEPAATDKPATEAKPDAAAPGAEAKKDEPKPKPKPKVPPPPPPPPPEPDMMDMVMDNLPIAGGALLAVLGGAGFFFMRRRRAQRGTEPAAAEQADYTPPAKAEPTVVMAAPLAAAPAAAAPASDEVDPLAEAEVYVAYGRDAQAEEILKEAMSKDPSRVEIPVKLAEIYAARKDKGAFDAVAATVNTLTGGTGDHWNKVAGMGYALDPANALYAGGKDVQAAEPLASETTGTDLDFNLDISAPASAETDIQLDAGPAAAPTDTVMLDAGSVPAEQPAEPAPAPADQPLMPDFNLELPSEAPAAPAEAPALDVPALDVPAAAPAAESNSIDFNIELPPAGGGSEPAAAAAPAAEAPSSGGLDFKLDDISFNLDDSAAPAKDAGKDAHWYDVQQKFDLAKAYQEMGEKDNAREILNEVIKEGDDEQKAQAQKLLESLG